MSALVWMHRDLRLQDNPALAHAVRHHASVEVVYAWSDAVFGDWMPGAAQRWWIHEHLMRVASALSQRGIRFTLTTDSPVNLVAGGGYMAVYWNEPITPAARALGQSMTMQCRKEGTDMRVFSGDLLHDPDAIRTQKGDPYRVFTPFYRSFLAGVPVSMPVALPDMPPAPAAAAAQLEGEAHAAIDALALVPDHAWVSKVASHWEAGEDAAMQQLKQFVDGPVLDYDTGRNRPDREGSSRLSPYLAIGVLSPRQVWHETSRRHVMDGSPATFLKEIGWREFGYHLLYHFPGTVSGPLNPSWNGFPWRDDAEGLRAWQRGETGYPIVDAGMHELWNTGWMHNRVRMIVASFLTKDLLVSWQAGAAWFWDTLIDADLASNTLGWQWAAGCGADAQPFFRIFNPDSQQKTHDPKGQYVRQWTRGRAMPIVDHAEARARALAVYQAFRDA